MSAGTDTRGLLGKVEEAWYERTKGELVLVPDKDDLIPFDADLAEVVATLTDYAYTAIEETAAAQYAADGSDIDTVDDAEMARRVALALEVVLYGGGEQRQATGIMFKDEGEDEGEAFGRIWLQNEPREREALKAAGIDPDSTTIGVPFGFWDDGTRGLVEVWGTKKQALTIATFLGLELDES